YKALDIVHDLMFRLQKYEDKGAPLSMGIGFYRAKPILDELKKSYFYRLKRYMVVPALKYLEYDIRSRSSSFGELAGEEYKSLYNSLKAYLSISEGGPRNSKEIDTTFLRPILLDAIKQSILATIKGSRLPTKAYTILYDNMGLYLSYLSRGEFPRIQENQNLVSNARKRLSRIPSAEGLYNAVISQVMSEAPSYNLDNILKREGEGILQSNATISILYTAEGWEQYVRDAINDAAKDPCKSDWVIGTTEEELKTFSFDANKLRDGMIEAYANDCKIKWLSFLGSISMEPFGDLQRTSRILQKLVGTNSEIVTLLETVGTLTQLKYESEAEKAGGKVLEAASNLKATKKAAEMLSKVSDKIVSTLGEKDPFEKHNAFFNNIRAFIRSGSSLGGYEGYKDKILTLAEKCGTIDAQGESKAIAIFNGKEDDPLLSGWNLTIKILNGMPEELASSLRNILLQPFEYTGSTVSRVLTRTLNQKWQEDVIKQFTNRLSGRYPFNIRGDETSFRDVMDFFRPTSGTFWGFYDRVLSSFIVKDGNNWMVKQLGSVKLNFNPQIFSTLTQAERIKNIFFKEDGTIRSLDISITPAAGNKYISKIVIGTQELELRPGSKSVNLKWPAEGINGAILRVEVSRDFTPEIVKNGQWGFMKLLQEGKISKFNNSSFGVKWSINVQNQYMVFIEGRVSVAGSDHPFTDKIFESFDCPTILLKESENKNL
ncbi:MAG: hypothetical protein N2053_00890, partial [Chitinispirillaceae bacterium]|nr:hypothetical protein [Chitinispirillaceae bacterium]